jgi:hypothetical protein
MQVITAPRAIAEPAMNVNNITVGSNDIDRSRLVFVVIEPSGKLSQLSMVIACADYWLGPVETMVLVRGNVDERWQTAMAAAGQLQ